MSRGKDTHWIQQTGPNAADCKKTKYVERELYYLSSGSEILFIEADEKLFDE